MQQTQRPCKKCGVSKDCSDFYTTSNGGLYNKCKPCYRADVVARYRANPEMARAYEQSRAKKPERRAKALEYQRQRRAREPAKRTARYELNNAIQRGRIIPPLACSRCRATGVEIQGHHTDYTRPLEVEWLCFLCHRQYGHGQSVQGLTN